MAHSVSDDFAAVTVAKCSGYLFADISTWSHALVKAAKE